MHGRSVCQNPARALALALLTILSLYLGGPATPAGAAPGVAAEPAVEPSPMPSAPPPRERTTVDRLVTVAAIGSIVLVAVAGTYIYVLIRRGL